MIAFKYIDQSITSTQLIELGNKIDKCGAIVFFDGKPLQFKVIVDKPAGEEEIAVIHCIEADTTKAEQGIIEHALGEWYMQFNLNLDRLSEEGYPKNTIETQEIAEQLTLGDIIGEEYIGVFTRHNPLKDLTDLTNLTT